MLANDSQNRASAKMAKSQSPLAVLFRALARASKFREFAIKAICRLEGGQMWSSTYRELMRVHYSVEIGMHSYGPCLAPQILPAGTRVGNYCSLAAGLHVFRRNHPVERVSLHPFFFNAAAGLIEFDTIPSIKDNPLIIGHDVWIGQNVIIAPGCRSIGDGAVIASGAVVAADVPPLAIVGGVPARMIRWRFSEELRSAWKESEWWLKPIPELVAELSKFTEPFSLRQCPRHKRSPVATIS